MRSLRLTPGNGNGFHPEAEVENMKHPHKYQQYAACYNTAEGHDSKADAHQQRNGDHDADLGLTGHAPAGHIVLQIIFVELRIDKPAVQSF